LDHLLHLAKFGTAKAPTPLKTYWIKPEFRDVLISLNMHMGWFAAITGIKEKTIRADSVNCWHLVYALLFSSANNDGDQPLRARDKRPNKNTVDYAVGCMNLLGS